MNDSTVKMLEIDRLAIDIKVTGNIATTTFDINYYNSTDRVLEGEFDFPLADGQNICRYALDINGTLREGVVVEKAKARVAYESTVRRKIDPGLVEKTKGNNFRTRIYPIPAKGYKHVVIAVEQALTGNKEGLVYQLPLLCNQVIKEFSLTATVFKHAEKPVVQNSNLNGFDFNKENTSWIADYKASGFVANTLVEFILNSDEGQVYTEIFEGNNYFYTHIDAAPDYRDKKNPAAITLLWDISASAEKRDIKKEAALLNNYFKRLGNVTVHLVPFNISTSATEQFIIKEGNAAELLARLQSFTFDGGTQLGALDLNQYNDEAIILFSDGLSTFGKKEILLSSIPVTVVNSSAAPDYSYLKNIALQTHGRFINLNEATPENAVNEMASEPLQFIKATYDVNKISEFYTQVNTNLQNGFSFTGILKNGPATIELHFGFGNTVTVTKKLIIKDDGDITPNTKRIWATTKIAQLDLEYEKNKDAITQLGKKFSVVTQNTSLLVLDRVEDYVQHEIVPPVELQKEYFTLLKEKQRLEADEKSNVYDEAKAAMDELKEWYNKKLFATVPQKADSLIDTYSVSDSTFNFLTIADSIRVTQGFGTFSAANATATTNSRTTEYAFTASESNAVQFTPPQIVKDDEIKNESLTGSIQLNEWKPEAAYLKELEKTAPAKYIEKYQQLKKDYNSQPSFFVDVARFMFEKNDKAAALLILSNIAEMKLENPELLRIVANQLLEFGETGLAAEVFKEVTNIREEEPQSYRDLALAYNETGKYQQAIDLLYKLITGKWDTRFTGIRSIAINEMNAIISAHPNEVNIAAIDKKFILSMPVDVRIVIGWSSNDSDIDLWVTDPAKEKCFFENTTTSTGGKISQDITQGYGPEEFSLKKAKKGDYTIEVNLYGDSRQTIGGPITIKAELFTNFGRPNQNRSVINCRVTSNKEVIRIGALHFASNS
ncbi:VIT domain-containing protein [Ferruginibacter sp.]